MGPNARHYIVNTRVSSNYYLPNTIRRVKPSRGRIKIGLDIAYYIINARVNSVLISLI